LLAKNRKYLIPATQFSKVNETKNAKLVRLLVLIFLKKKACTKPRDVPLTHFKLKCCKMHSIHKNKYWDK